MKNPRHKATIVLTPEILIQMRKLTKTQGVNWSHVARKAFAEEIQRQSKDSSARTAQAAQAA